MIKKILFFTIIEWVEDKETKWYLIQKEKRERERERIRNNERSILNVIIIKEYTN